MREKQEINIKKLRDEALEEIAKTLPENIQEPKLNILGPTLEASKYYIEEDELRVMFAKLIASSMDKSKSDQVHPSFVEVIKQLSSKEAILLKNLNSRNPFGRILLIENKKNPSLDSFPSENFTDFRKMIGRKSKTVIDHFYYSNKNNDYLDNDFSISALHRLGLIDVKNDTLLSDETVYLELDKEFENFKSSELARLVYDPVLSFELEKGSIDITPFGLFFCSSCIK